MESFAQGTGRRHALAVCTAVAIAIAGGPAHAADDELSEVTVTGTRIARSGLETPTPVTTVTTTDLQDMNPRQLIEGLSQLPQFFNNRRPQGNAPLFSGGSNLDLRGAGAARTLVLLNGRRLPNGNRYGAVDVSTLPEAAISNVETVTGGASAAYGTDAVAGVVNFVLNTKFNGFQGRVAAGETSRHDGDNYTLSATYGTDLGERGHLLVSADWYDQEAIWSLASLQSRPWMRQQALVTDPSGRYTFLRRDFVKPSNTSTSGVINSPNALLDKLEFQRSGTGIITQRLNFSGVGRLNGGCNCYAEPQRDQSWGIDADNAVQQANGRHSAFVYLDYDVSDSLNVYLQGMYGVSEVRGPWFSSPVMVGATWQGTIFSGNPFLPANVQQIMTANNVPSFNLGLTGATRADREGGLGLYSVHQSNELTSGTLGFEKRFTSGALEDWKLTGYAQYGANHQDMHFRNGLITSRLYLALDAVTSPTSGQPVCRAALLNPSQFGDCVPVNLFGGVDSVSPAARNYLVDESTNVKSDYSQVFSEAVLSGSFYEGVGAGPFRMAVGASYRRDEVRQWKSDLRDEFVFINGVNTGLRGLLNETQPGGRVGVRGIPTGFQGNASLANVLFTGSIQTPDTVLQGSFSVKEAFTEFNLPLLKDKPFVAALETDLAYRIATYTGSGSIASWKYGLSWQVVDSFRIRATQSRDVRAANIRERFDATAGGANVRDPLNNGVQVNGATSFTGGNPNVNPEEADTTTFGAVWQPSGALQGFSASVDWYDIDISGALGQLPQQIIVDRCASGQTDLCRFVTRDANNQIVRLDILFLNLANQRIRGVDAELQYNRPIELFGGAERVGLRLYANRIAENSQQFPAQARDFLSLEQPEWRFTSNVVYQNGPLRAFIQGRWIDNRRLNRLFNTGLPNAQTVEDNVVGSVFYTDLNISFEKDWGKQRLRFFGNVTNLLDRAPPQTPTTIGTGGTGQPSLQYDTIGRTYTVGMNVSF
jgi:iron complex outermembrane recepter protein